MSNKIIFAVLALCAAFSFGEAVKCYHCYDAYNQTLFLGNDLSEEDLGPDFVRCDKNKNNWNSWDCPSKWPICIVMGGKVKTHYEVARTCAEQNFCSNYKPPQDVTIDYCYECNTTLCNDYPKKPDPPINGPLYNFNININLNLKKYPVSQNDDNE